MVLGCGMPGHPRTEEMRRDVAESEVKKLYAEIWRLLTIINRAGALASQNASAETIREVLASATLNHKET